jgi:hypothetical protein
MTYLPMWRGICSVSICAAMNPTLQGGRVVEAILRIDLEVGT